MNNILKVHSIESFGTHDGPGLRMVIFLQGCNLKCLYCQNADTIPIGGGTNYTIDELIKRADGMKGYFGAKGGVTVSGGEPLLQSDILIPFFLKLKELGIHTNIDTNGTINNTSSQRLISEISDLIMFDIKHATPSGFTELTGRSLFSKSVALINLREQSKKPYWFRYVLVPGYTDSIDQLKLVGEKYKNSKYLERFQVLPYHKLGEYKWEALGEIYKLKDTPENTHDQIEQAKNILKNYFSNVI